MTQQLQSSATLPDRSTVESLVRRLRSEVSVACAEDYAREFEQSHAAAEIESSILKGHVEHLHADDPYRLVGFNLEVTDRVIERLIAEVDDAGLLTFAVSRAIELSGHSFIDPLDLRRVRPYLGAAKQWGFFFTPPDVAAHMARGAIGSRKQIRHLLDPAAGAGSLVATTLIRAANVGVRIERVTAVEINARTAERLDRLLARVVDLLDVPTQVEVVAADALEWLDPDNGHTADCIIMNPPYGRVKFLKDTLTNSETQRSERSATHAELAIQLRTEAMQRAEQLRSLSERLGLGRGAQDYQRLFIGLALEAIDPGGRFSFIAPASWLGDRNSASLRRRLVKSRLLEEVTLYPEDSGLFSTVNQVTAVALVSPGSRRRGFRLRHSDRSSGKLDTGFRIDYDEVERFDPEALRIPRLHQDQLTTLESLQRLGRVRDLAHVSNFRGELDQTAGKSLIRSERTDLRLVRGDHLERFILRPPEYSDRPSYVDRSKYMARMGDKPKTDHMRGDRVACRQVSYMNKERRLSFALVPPDVVLGNSCNYLTVPPDSGQSRQFLMALAATLNSSVHEWFFRVNNSNNHVANYELDELPAIIPPEGVEPLAAIYENLNRAYESNGNGGRRLPVEDALDALVALYHGLADDQLRMILNDLDVTDPESTVTMLSEFRSSGVPKEISTGVGWLNHVMPSMSELDIEMASWVTQGGNWQDIPESVPSTRLEQIREMSRQRGLVRTTYYGRLRPEQPAYTIATYYNRPGNGTNINPWVDRTLTHREAARLQSFPDSYLFTGGSDGSIRKQIGNAVPPLLGRAVASSLASSATSNLCVDLFCGAGGLSLGFELAGWEVAASVDFDKKALSTYRLNHATEAVPDSESDRTLVLEADLSDYAKAQSALDLVAKKLDGRPLGALVGGPPCQGFSHAGWRSRSDERNDLAVSFLRAAETLRPQVVVMENVEGLLTFQKGAVVKGLLKALSELGYNIGSGPWKLESERFGVPQMRRRVFLVGTLGERPRSPAPLFQKCHGRREFTANPPLFEDNLPYPVTCAEALSDLPRLGAISHASMGPREVRGDYGDWVSGKTTVDEFYQATRG